MRTLPLIGILMMMTGMALVSESQSISSAIAQQLSIRKNTNAPAIADRGSGRRESQSFFYLEDKTFMVAQRGSGRCKV